MRCLPALLLVCSIAAHADDWTKTDTGLEVAWLTLHALDWGQTRYIARNPDLFYERNPILGDHPSVGRVNTYFALTAIAHYGVSQWLSPSNRRIWQTVSIGFAAGTVNANYNIGVRLDF